MDGNPANNRGKFLGRNRLPRVFQKPNLAAKILNKNSLRQGLY
jgi:hypothetical protein